MSQANPADDINRIIIGLGGQGSRVVNEVRKAVLEKGPLPPGLEFIAVDSDRVALSSLDSVPEAHRIHLAAPDDNITETVVPWLPHEFRPKAGGGCGMQRLTGKAMYLVHRHRIMETVREVARKLRQRTQVSNFMVVVVNAFGGGTGSGMAIDFSVDLRADLKEITGQDPLLFGIGMLPSRSETIQRANGVAAVKELHLLLSNKEPVVVGGRDYSNPFELYFLVGREIMGIERDEELLRSIVRFTIDLGLIPSSSREHSAAGKGAGWVDLQDIRTLVKGAGHMFSTFGYYRAAFPADELLRYFESLDKLKALRKELPSFRSDADSARQALDDKRIALAHAEEVVRTSKRRAARLRMDGILGANRPELAKLLGEIGRKEDEIRKTRREIAEAEGQMPGLDGKREKVEAELREWEARAEALKASILAPTQTRTSYTVPLTEAECETLSQNRQLLVEGNFMSVMSALGRMPDYHDKTMEVVGKNKILYMPLVNYRMAFHTAAAFPAPVISALRKHEFVRFDAAGNPVVADDHLWMVMAMLSSQPENIDPNKVAARAFKEVVEGHIARRAEVKIVPSRSKRFEVVIHSWMVGLQVAPVAPGYPPRLRELEWLMPEYEQVAREGGLAQHHAFLYGDPLAFARLTGVSVDRASMARTHELVTGYWASYAPIDAHARWMQLPPLLAETMVATDQLAKSVAALADGIDEFRTGDAGMSAADRLNAALAQGIQQVEGFRRAFAEDATPLRGRLETLVAHLEATTSSPRDPSKLLAMDELATEAAGSAASALGVVRQLREELPAGVGGTISHARRAAGRPNGMDRTAIRSGVRWEHALAHAEARAAQLYELTAEAIDHLAVVERTLERVQSLVRARSVPPVGALDAGATGSAFASAVAAAVAPPALDAQLASSGNGHHAGAETLLAGAQEANETEELE